MRGYLRVIRRYALLWQSFGGYNRLFVLQAVENKSCTTVDVLATIDVLRKLEDLPAS
jgi:hypothetical protein